MELKPINEAPNLKECKEMFGVSEDTVIIAYGNAIYVPEGGIAKDLIVHELVHCERQGFDETVARRWWKRYFEDKSFRLEEELVAYKKQYEFCCRVYKDRNKRYKILNSIASELSSATYGKIIGKEEAMEKLSTP